MIRAFFTNSFGILLSRISGLLRDLLMAKILGVGMWSDIFFIAFKLPNLFRRLFAEGAFTQAFLPSFIKSTNKAILLAKILLRFVIFILFLTLFVYLYSDFFTRLLAFGFNEKTIILARPFVFINFWYLLFIFIVTLFASLLQYKNHFLTTAFSTILLNLAMIIALLISKNMDKEIIVRNLSYSVVIGGFLQLIAHLIAIKRLKLLKFLINGFKKINTNIKDTKEFYKNFFYGVIGQSAMQLGSFLDTCLASFLTFGSISYLYYANRIFQLPLAVFAIALSTAIFPKIAKAIKGGDKLKAKKLLCNAFYILLALLLFSSIGGIILKEEIIKLLFQRGNFNHKNTLECARVLEMFLIGLTPFGLSKLFSLWLYSNMKQLNSSLITIKSLILNLIISISFLHTFGVSALAFASSISGFYLLFMNIKEFGLRNFLDIIDFKKILLIFTISLVEILILLQFKEIINANL